MLSEVGSNFWLTPAELKQDSSAEINAAQFGCVGNDSVLLSTGRSAISFVLDTIELRNPQVTKVAVLPPFTCHTVIEPFLNKGYEIHTYHVGINLMSSAADLLNTVEQYHAGVILIHKYFGMDTIQECDDIIPKLRKMGTIVIEDCTQCLYSSFSKVTADYWVGSIRKWCGVPDGGYAVCREGYFMNKPIQIDKDLQTAKVNASILKYNYIFECEGEKSAFLDLYRKAEDILSAQNTYYAISNVSKTIQSNLDWELLKAKRRSNYEEIAKGLAGHDRIKVIFKSINDNVVPLYCPILCDDRHTIQKELAANNIYAPVVWPESDICPEVDCDAKYIYNHILCIPIDQRYDKEDMERILKVIYEI